MVGMFGLGGVILDWLLLPIGDSFIEMVLAALAVFGLNYLLLVVQAAATRPLDY